MDVASFCRQSRVIVVAGKGGVGKSTVTAALARMAAEAGLSVLIVELEGKPGLPAAFGVDETLGYDEVILLEATPEHGAVTARRITPDDALLEYLADHGMRRVSKRLVKSGALDVVSSAVPGLKDILVLGRVKQLERAQAADLIVVDAPATGHAMTFLTSAHGLLDAARAGPVRTQASDVVAMISDPTRCRVLLVTIPEETPVNEAIEAAYTLEDKVDVALGPVVVNGCLSDDAALGTDPADAARAAGVALGADQTRALGDAAVFHRHRVALQSEQLERLAAGLPLPQLRVPFLFSATVGPHEIAQLARALRGAVDTLEDAAPPDRVEAHP